ncbi:hypothetical protein ICN28_00155 [Polynucleobacter sp. 30F-ANTBAC]|jgi:DNA-binding XRE family transcriptional regulator|uniref:hypothetical protein n=1 Tax=Polynucleobacter sp. 30F-ANTBAC TaxID=2689095 RepID=UPI001C0C9851|nr:hypothetical protein [Polynucleobacter sp. 30F-ANTBAC]MBU3598926.1 hypothetical protein [Polynucleobacter sp. 30F-ANTBAC]
MVADLKTKVEITPEIQGGVLKSARVNLRITPEDLAKKACLSKKHIIELEEGGLSSFYSLAHKVRVAKKVSLLLSLKEDQALLYPGGDLAKQESLPFDAAPQDGNGLSDAATSSSSTDSTRLSQSLQSEVQVKSDEPQVDSKKVSKNSTSSPKKSAPQDAVSLETIGQNFAASQTSSKKSWKPVVSLFLIVLVAGGLFATKDEIAELINPQPLPLPMPEVSQIEASEEKPGDTAPVVVPATLSPSMSTVTPTTSIPPLPSEAGCPKADAVVASHSVSEPNKAGNFVFVQSKIKQTVCVSDVSGKVTVMALDAGASHTFTGKAPFTVLSSGLSNLAVYFQGRPVRLSNEQARSIRLEEGKLVN